MIDVEGLRRSVDLADLVGRYVTLKNDGRELKACCPFHEERTPSFTVVPAKGFVHCFGCGAHHDAIGFVMAITGASFQEACEQLGARDFREAKARAIALPAPVVMAEGGVWIPIYPVPDDAPPVLIGQPLAIWNPKRQRFWNARPSRADAYRDARGRLMGYVLRIEFKDGKKITPQLTWCIGPSGIASWCSRPFPRPRPLCGLDELAAKPLAPVLFVEGEKCRAAGAGALPMYAVLTWPGGSKGIGQVDWSPLLGRDVVLWPDADKAGREAMLGWASYSGVLMPGVAQYAHRYGCTSIRIVDPAGQPPGWDIADAIDDGWTPRQIAAWAALRVKDVEVTAQGARRAA